MNISYVSFVYYVLNEFKLKLYYMFYYVIYDFNYYVLIFKSNFMHIYFGSREESEVMGFFVFSHIYFSIIVFLKNGHLWKYTFKTSFIKENNTDLGGLSRVLLLEHKYPPPSFFLILAPSVTLTLRGPN